MDIAPLLPASVPVKSCFAGLIALAICAAPAALHGQLGDHIPIRRPATTAELIGGNILVGGLTAATRAALTGKDPFRAFGMGALGGAVHLAGKRLAVQPGAANGWLGLIAASTGTSIVSNAGRGVGPFEELTIPVVVARLRFTPRAERRFRIGVNALETAVLVEAAATRDLNVDWSRTARSGAFVFVTQDKRILVNGKEVWGFAASSVIVIGAFSNDHDRTMRHEVVHIHQQRFMDDAWGRPIEEYLRSKVGFARYIPSWLELGLVAPTAMALGRRLSADTDLYRLLEAEAERLERR